LLVKVKAFVLASTKAALGTWNNNVAVFKVQELDHEPEGTINLNSILKKQGKLAVSQTAIVVQVEQFL
jgi:hypothetical protein